MRNPVRSGLPPTYHILLTIDVEDWFQVENLRQSMPCYSWHSHELRVKESTHCLLDLLDSIKLENSNDSSSLCDDCPIRTKDSGRVKCPSYLAGAANLTKRVSRPIEGTVAHNSTDGNNTPKATFFVLGWVAERLPCLVREIRSRGHEVASHGYYHTHCTHLPLDFLKQDLSDSRRLLEDVIGDAIYGYRAPNFSVDVDLLKIIQECGYLYDSSFNSFALNGRYGSLDVTKNANLGIAAKISDTFYELPISNLRLGNRILPWGGGGYFRLTPRTLFRAGVRLILKKDGAYLFYMHPWELDPKQPRVDAVSRFSRFRHYTNLKKTEVKLSSFIEAFREHTFVTCHEYLQLASLYTSSLLNSSTISFDTNQLNQTDKLLPLSYHL